MAAGWQPNGNKRAARGQGELHLAARAYHYRTATGHELELSASKRWALEFKKSSAPQVERGFHIACDDIAAERRLLVYPGTERWPAKGGVEVTPLVDAVAMVAEAG